MSYDPDESQARRASHRENSPEMLKAAGISFITKNGGAHLIVSHNGKTVDFWPGTGRWDLRPADGKKRRGVFELIKYLSAVGPNWIMPVVNVVLAETLSEVRPVRPGALISSRSGPYFGVVLRWPADRLDWEPIGDGSDEWVVLWFNFSRNGVPAGRDRESYEPELCCAEEFEVIGYLPEETMKS